MIELMEKHHNVCGYLMILIQRSNKTQKKKILHLRINNPRLQPMAQASRDLMGRLFCPGLKSFASPCIDRRNKERPC